MNPIQDAPKAPPHGSAASGSETVNQRDTPPFLPWLTAVLGALWLFARLLGR